MAGGVNSVWVIQVKEDKIGINYYCVIIAKLHTEIKWRLKKSHFQCITLAISIEDKFK